MTTLTLDLEQFTAAMVKATKKTLGWVKLQPILAPGDEVTPPSYTPDPPSVMAGSSFSGASPATDISLGTDNKFNISDGVTSALVTLTVAGKITGALIATELETQINSAFTTAGAATRVRVVFDSIYKIYSDATFEDSKLIITDATSNNVADDLKLGVANGGVETVGSYVLIDAKDYKFDYGAVRYARFCYLLERDGNYETGELTVLHDLVVSGALPADESSPPPAPAPFSPPNITMGQTILMGSIGSLGVVFLFKHDVATGGSDAKFGLAYRIMTDTPALYPKLNLSYITAIAPEDV